MKTTGPEKPADAIIKGGVSRYNLSIESMFLQLHSCNQKQDII